MHRESPFFLLLMRRALTKSRKNEVGMSLIRMIKLNKVAGLVWLKKMMHK